MTKHHTTKMIAKPGQQEIIVIREFDAPRELVFKTWTNSEYYPRWIGPRELTTQLQKFDVKSGGSYRFVQTEPSGQKHAFHGFYHEVSPPDRIIYTFEYDNLPEKGHVSLASIAFESMPDKRTKMTARSVFLSVADRDGMLAGDMERGEIESYERLDELLEKLHQEDCL